MIERRGAQYDANGPSGPWRYPGERIEQAEQEERAEAVSDDCERLGIGMPAAKGFADCFHHLGAGENHCQRQEQLSRFGDHGLAA